MNNCFTDVTHLRESQYRDATNLDYRAALHDRFSTSAQYWHRWVFEQLDLPADARLLEVGSGPGPLWEHNSTAIPDGWCIYVSDFSWGMVGEARSRIQSKGTERYLTLDAQALPFDSEHFDAAVANHMLYHVPDLGRSLAELRRVIRPTGQLYATTNGELHLDEMVQFVSAAKSERDHATVESFRRSIGNFNLENGIDTFREWFSEVRVSRFHDSLRVTEIEAIVSFVQSSTILRLDEDELPRLRALLQAEMETSGAISIRKDSGLIVGTVPYGP